MARCTTPQRATCFAIYSEWRVRESAKSGASIIATAHYVSFPTERPGLGTVKNGGSPEVLNTFPYDINIAILLSRYSFTKGEDTETCS
jgi:hypothetical protein